MPVPADMSRPVMGFGQNIQREGEDTEAIKRLFTPEFRNRLDAVITFSGLTPTIIRNVVDKFVKELGAQLADKRVAIELDEEAAAWLAEKGYDPLYGARPLARVIQDRIKRPLADELLFGKLAKGGKVLRHDRRRQAGVPYRTRRRHAAAARARRQLRRGHRRGPDPRAGLIPPALQVGDVATRGYRLLRPGDQHGELRRGRPCHRASARSSIRSSTSTRLPAGPIMDRPTG